MLKIETADFKMFQTICFEETDATPPHDVTPLLSSEPKCPYQSDNKIFFKLRARNHFHHSDDQETIERSD